MSDRLPPERVVREPRFRLSEQYGAHVTVCIEDPSATPFSAELLDISRTGIKLRAASSLRFEQKIQLHIAIDALDTQLDVSALVRWMRPVSNEDWVLGCSLEPSLPEDIVTRLATATGTERRHAARYPIHVEAPATWELRGRRRPSPVTLCNISTGGFGVCCESMEQIGQRVVVHLRQPDGTVVDIQGQTKWTQNTSEGCIVGCAFLNRRSFEALRDYTGVEFEEDRVERVSARQPSPARRQTWYVAALMLAILWPWLELSPMSTGRTGLSAPSEMLAKPAPGIPPTPPEPSDLSLTRHDPRPTLRPVDQQLAVGAAPLAQSSTSQQAETAEPSESGERLRGDSDTATEGIASAEANVERDGIESAIDSMRIWTDSSGLFRVRAALLGFDGTAVQLLKQDGGTCEVQLTQLSDEDRRYVANFKKKTPPSP